MEHGTHREPTTLSTIAIVPRETSSLTARSVEGIIATVPDDVPIIVVDTFPRDVHEDLCASLGTGH